MANSDEREEVFSRLKKSISKHKRKLDVQKDEPSNYYLNCKKPDSNGKPVFFGAVQVRKSYVSYHLMPVYMYPDLLKGISPELKKRMQGKSCFNFKKEITEEQLNGIKELTKKSYKKFIENGYIEN